MGLRIYLSKMRWIVFLIHAVFVREEFGLILYVEVICIFFLFLNISISLNFFSNSLRSFLNSPMLLLGEGQNLSPSLSKFIWSLFNLCVDKFIIFGLMLLSFFIFFFSYRSFCLKMVLVCIS